MIAPWLRQRHRLQQVLSNIWMIVVFCKTEGKGLTEPSARHRNGKKKGVIKVYLVSTFLDFLGANHGFLMRAK